MHTGVTEVVAGFEEVTYTDFLDRLLAEEVAAKIEKHITMRTAMARFPCRKTLEGFDFSFQPSLDRKNSRTWPWGRHIWRAREGSKPSSRGIARCSPQR